MYMNNIFKLKQIPFSLDLVKRVSILLSVTTLIMLILNINRFVDLRGGGIGNPNMRVIKEYFADGSLRREIHILNGKREGALVEYYQNGTIEWYSHYRDGVKSGIQKWYNSHGILEWECNYKEDIKDGLETRPWDLGRNQLLLIPKELGPPFREKEDHHLLGGLGHWKGMGWGRRGIFSRYLGQVALEAYYYNNMLHGRYRKYNRDGKLVIKLSI